MSGRIIGGNHVERIDDGQSHLTAFRGLINKIPQAEYEKIVQEVLDDISELIGQTLGPNGWTILVTEPYGASPVFPNKDGFRGLLNIKYDNPIYHVIYQVSRDISSRMNQKVGDGTTSGNIIIAALYKNLMAVRESTFTDRRVAPTAIRPILKELELILVRVLQEKYIIPLFNLARDPLFPEEQIFQALEKVATVAANNDPKIASDVIGVFRRNGFDVNINVETGIGEETIFEENTGFELTSGYLLNSYVTDADGVHVTYNEPLYLMVDGPLTGADFTQFAQFVGYVCEELRSPLIVIAAAYTQEYTNFFTMVRAGVQQKDGSLYRYPIVSIIEDATGSTVYSSRFQDIVSLLGASPFPTKDGKLIDFEKIGKTAFVSKLGQSAKFRGSPFSSNFIGGYGDPDLIKGRISEIEKEIAGKSLNESVQFQMKIAGAKKRIAMLKGKMTSIKVGGVDFKSKQYFALVYEDAFSAVRSAIEHGFSLGGNLAINHAIANNRQAILDELFAAVKKNRIHIVFGNQEEAVKGYLSNVIDAVGASSLAAFIVVLMHCGIPNEEVNQLVSGLTADDSPFRTLNILTGEEETLSFDSNLLVAGNTDVEILSAVFAVVSTFLTSRVLMPLYHPGNGQ